jgi:hypothetical protein
MAEHVIVDHRAVGSPPIAHPNISQLLGQKELLELGGSFCCCNPNPLDDLINIVYNIVSK